MNRNEQKSGNRRFRFIDFLIIVLCLSLMAYSVKLFRDDLFQTINQQNVEPVGTITIKNNTVQRRIADRVLWDRLSVESPVYLGDIIRVAEFSAATLNIEDQHIDIDENTLIRIQLASDGALQIELTEGNLAYSNLGVTTGAESGPAHSAGSLQLNLMGRVIETGAGTALTAAAGKDGIVLQVNEGKAIFIDESGERKEVSSGTMIARNAAGTEQLFPAAVVTQPRPNARYVKASPQPLPVAFAWNRVNLNPQATLHLEIAADRNFSRVVQSAQNLVSAAEVSLEAGVWNWRLSHEGTILSGGRITVVEASNVSLLSPAKGSLFRYSGQQPTVRFQWSAMDEASQYVIEIASTPDFANPRINRRIDALFFVDSSLPEGTWYWRVQPVFSSAYEGGASFSGASFFRVEQSAAAQPVTLLDGGQLRELEQTLGNNYTPQTAITETPPAESPTQAASTQAATAPAAVAAAPAAAAPAAAAPTPTAPAAAAPAAAPTTATTPTAPTPVAATQTAVTQLLPAPANREPVNNYRIGIEQIKTRRNIVFRWAAVQGANAYIFTLYEQIANGRRQINSVTITNPAWTLENINVLGRGTFVWQVEAVSRNSGGAITRRGETAENTFTMDIPAPRPVQMNDPGVLYGY